MQPLEERKKIATRVEKILDELYPDPQIPLKHDSPFTLLVAVVLSAQCTDARVNLVTAKLFEAAKTPQELASMPLETLEEIIKPCGLYKTKAKNLLALSKRLLEDFGGEVPGTFEELESLPGVGHKTASVIMAHIFKKPAFPVDTHIHRLAARWSLSDGSSVEHTELDLKAVFKKSHWEKLHLQIIYFGRNYCKALGHKAATCPICKTFGYSESRLSK